MDAQQYELPQTIHADAEHNLLASAAAAEVARHAQPHKTAGAQHALTSRRCCARICLCRTQLISDVQSEKRLGSGLTTVWTVCYPYR